MTEATHDATFLPVPAWWVPVWVELQGDTKVLDPLEKAVLALVHAGRSKVATMAADLCVPKVLVRSSIDHLLLRGRVRVDEAGEVWRVDESDAEDAEPPVAVREAWVAWDPLHQRPVSEIWIDSRYPNYGPVGAPPDDRSPRADDLDAALRLLPHLDNLDLLVPREGSDGSERPGPSSFPRGRVIEKALLRGLRLRDAGRTRRGGMLVPTEQRLGSIIVWRPALRAHDESLGELDPLGLEGLQQRGEQTAQTIHAQLTETADEQLGPLLEKEGFNSLEEVRAAARREARSAIGAGWSADAWPLTTHRVQEAYVEQRVGQLLSGDWRRLAQGWAHVVEAFTQELVSAAMPIVQGANGLPGIPGPDQHRLRRILPDLSKKTLSDLEKPDKAERTFTELRRVLRNDNDSVGHRLATIAVAARIDHQFRSALFDADSEVSGVMLELDTAAQQRNAVMHEKRSGGDVDVHGFRERVLAICRAWMGTGLRRGG